MSFEKQIKHHVCQNVLHLHELWPAKRTRWWAIIAHPALAIQSIPRIPVLRLGPSIIHVIRNLLNMPADQLSQLEPTQYELRQFYFAKGGIGRSVIDMYRAMPTATHSWGSQVVACHCQCRSQGFSQSRLDDKGLYAVLIPLNHVEEWGMGNSITSGHEASAPSRSGISQCP